MNMTSVGKDSLRTNATRPKLTRAKVFFRWLADHIDDPRGSYVLSKITGWRLFVIIVVGLIGLGVCCMVAYIIFSKRQEESRKRFY